MSFAHLALAEDLKGVKLIPEDISLWDESLAWDKTFEAHTGVGYKDNVLLRHLNPKGSPFVASGLEFTVIRLLELLYSSGTLIFIQDTGTNASPSQFYRTTLVP